jgi:DNA primase
MKAMQVSTVTTLANKSYKNYRKEDWEDFKNKLQVLKDTIDPHYFLKELGFSDFRETPKEIRCACPIHGGDNTTAFRFNKETRTWVCFTHKCHENYDNDAIGLIRAMFKYDFKDAVDYLKDMVGDINFDERLVQSRRDREIQAFIDSYGMNQEKPKSVSERSLRIFKGRRSPFFTKKGNGGFEKTTLDFFEIAGGWVGLDDRVRDIIPIRNDRGELVAYSLRDTSPNVDYDRKYKLTPGFNKDKCLYNLHNAKEYAADKPLIVVEGFKSVWKMHECGIDNVVAVMGSEITEGQRFLLFTYALKGIVVLFDNDEAGVLGTQKAIETLSDTMPVRPVFIQEVDDEGNGLDPADLTKDQLYEYLNTYF